MKCQSPESGGAQVAKLGQEIEALSLGNQNKKIRMPGSLITMVSEFFNYMVGSYWGKK